MSDRSNPIMYVDSKLNYGKEKCLITWKGSSEVSLKCTSLGNSMVVLCKIFRQWKVLHIVETKENPSGSGLERAVLGQLFNGHRSTQIKEL